MVVMSPGSRSRATGLEHAAHDLAAPGLRQHGDERHVADHRDRPELAADRGDQLAPQLLGRLVAARAATNAAITSPRSSSGPPVTPASATAGWRRNAVSTSIVPIRWPAILMISSARPANQT